jgi:hypothetical protein
MRGLWSSIWKMRPASLDWRLSAKHGFVEATGLKTIGLDLALVAGDALVNTILALPRKRYLTDDTG